MADWLAIFNSTAGRGYSERERQSIAGRIREALNATVLFTDHRGHARELAREARSERLAVFGGDGTMSEVVNGMDLDRQCLLPLPGGTGNGLARDLGLASLDKGLDRAHAGNIRELDLIHVTFRTDGAVDSWLEISTASLGYVTSVVEAAKGRLTAWGDWRYTVASIVQAGRQPPFTLAVGQDGSEPAFHALTNVMVNNTRHAGNFRAFRHADPCDGQFEVLMARAGAAAQVLHNLAALTQTYFYATAQESTSDCLEIRLPMPQQLMIDGELWGLVNEVRFQILPRRLRCIA